MIDGKASRLVALSYLTPAVVIVGVSLMVWMQFQQSNQLTEHIHGPWHGAAGERHTVTEDVLRSHAERLAVVESVGIDDRFRGKDARAMWNAMRTQVPELPTWEELQDE